LTAVQSNLFTLQTKYTNGTSNLTFSANTHVIFIFWLEQVPKYTEIALVPKRHKGQFPGLFLFTSLARMMRPVIHLATGKLEYIGTFEQLYLDICIVPEEAYPKVSISSGFSDRPLRIPFSYCDRREAMERAGMLF